MAANDKKQMIFRYDNSDSMIKGLKGFQFHAGIAPNPLTGGSAQGHKSVVKSGGLYRVGSKGDAKLCICT